MQTAIELEKLTEENFEKLQAMNVILEFPYHGKLRRGLPEAFDGHIITLRDPQTKTENKFAHDDAECKNFSLEKIETAFIRVLPAK